MTSNIRAREGERESTSQHHGPLTHYYIPSTSTEKALNNIGRIDGCMDGREGGQAGRVMGGS